MSVEFQTIDYSGLRLDEREAHLMQHIRRNSGGVYIRRLWNANGNACFRTLTGQRCSGRGGCEGCALRRYLDHAALYHTGRGGPRVILANVYPGAYLVDEDYPKPDLTEFLTRADVTMVVGSPEASWWGDGTVPVAFSQDEDLARRVAFGIGEIR